MRGLEQVTARLGRSDMAQLFTLFLAVLVVVIGLAWPSAGSLANESWFSLGPARNAFLALAAAGFGASQGIIALPGHRAHGGEASHWLTEARTTLWSLLVWALLTVPFEVVSHAASFPSTSLALSVAITLITVPAYYGLGLLLRKFVALLRISWLLPILVPAVIAFLSWVDVRLDRSLFNPWTAALAPSPYPLIMGVAASLTLLYLFHPWRTRAGERGAAANPGATPGVGRS